MKSFLDYMLKNEAAVQTSIAVILIATYLIFYKINKQILFFLTLFITIKFTISAYVDHYIDEKRELKTFTEAHFASVKILTTLIILVPFMLISYYIGINVPGWTEE